MSLLGLHKKIERNSGLLIFGILVVSSIGGLVQIVPSVFQASLSTPAEGLSPYSPLELAGRDIYIRESCSACHSQQIRPLLAEVVSAVQAAARGASWPPIEVSGEDVTMIGDSYMLREVFLNLLLNACQASGRGQPVEVRLESGDGHVRVTVLDRRPGIPPDVRARVFEPFITTKPGGTGLGLPIVQRLLERQGGTIALADRDGGGTAATVTMPAPSGR